MPDNQNAIVGNFNKAVSHFNGGNYLEAEKLCRTNLQISPNHLASINLLGVIAQTVNRNDVAVDMFKKAIAIEPGIASLHNNLGVAYKEQNMFEVADECFNQAITLQPDYVDAHTNIANLMLLQGKLEKAVESCNRAIAIDVNCAAAYFNLANVDNSQGDKNAAIVNYKRAIAINPDYVDALYNLGALLMQEKQLLEAVQYLEKVVAIRPDFVDGYLTLGASQFNMGRLDDAAKSYKQITLLQPDNVDAHFSLGTIYNWQIKLKDAAECYKKAISLRAYDMAAYSSLFLCSQYMFPQTQENLFAMHKEFAKTLPNIAEINNKRFTNDINSNRKLRIGLVSPDLGLHPVGYFVTGFLKHHNKDELEISCYADHKNDELTQKLKSYSDNWVTTDGMAGDDLAQRITADKIDILIDLAGHTINNRLATFAKKPAPIQISWIGYVSTTGLPTIDYFIADKHSVSKNDERFYIEEILRLPDSWVCYTPPDNIPEIDRDKSHNRHTVLGCFANPAKINAGISKVWAEILRNHSNTKLLLMYDKLDDAASVERITSYFSENGVDKERIIIKGKRSHWEFLNMYNSVDIALDTMPYSGGLTTIEALLMGVPVVTARGETFAGRHGVSMLTTVGLKELVADNLDEYVKLVGELITDTQRLQKLKGVVRERLLQSALCDNIKFSQDLSNQLRFVWKKWCKNK
ncbi:MAG: tetratricopeptide repeat protein [Magnetococcales bacterium]|nr:tetratricopeptide repeat protein [Magnetococcales bacterium]